MSETKCTDPSALPRVGVCVTATPLDPGWFLVVPARSHRPPPRAVSAGALFCPCWATPLPLPHGRNTPRQGGGDPWGRLGSAWGRVGSCTRGMLSSTVLAPVRLCQSCWLLSYQLSRASARAADPAGMLRDAGGQENDPGHTALKIPQLSPSWLSAARISNQIEEESGGKNAGIIPGIGKRHALSGGPGPARQPCGRHATPSPGLAGKGPGEGCKGFPKRSWRKALGNSLEGRGWDCRRPYAWE